MTLDHSHNMASETEEEEAGFPQLQEFSLLLTLVALVH